MDEAHKELVKRLRERPFRHASESELEAAERRQSERVKAALALEALAEQRDRFVERFNETRQELNAITAERDRLKAAITTHVAGCVACGGRGVVFLCPERDDTAEAVREDCEECVGLRKALGDAS